jgi:hypothetical protein
MFKNLHAIDVAAVLARLAGLGILASDVTFQQAIGTLFNGNGAKIVAAIGLVAVIAADILRVIGNPSPPSPPTTVA